jgi:hypothetical protein
MDLRELWQDRSTQTAFGERDEAYKIMQSYIDSRNATANNEPLLTYRPLLQDAMKDEDDSQLTVNHCRRIVSHFTALFSTAPRWWSLGAEDKEGNENAGILLSQIARLSRLEIIQPRQANWLSARGDCVYGADWNERGPVIRSLDPQMCYPAFAPFDPGGVDDMLITYTISASEALRTYGVITKEEQPRVFIYWDRQGRWVQVEEHSIPEWFREHALGFCPFRWVFGGADTTMAQSDIRDVPRLQDLYDEAIQLAMDSMRKDVDPSWWASGVRKEIKPEAGQVTPLPDGAQVGRFETGGDAQTLIGMMNVARDSIESIAGVSPISMSGQAKGSIVTGAAVRHQVEAVEARTDSRKAMLQGTFAALGEQLFDIARMKLRDGVDCVEEIGSRKVRITHKLYCQAEYTGFLGLDLPTRVQILMTGLGRLWGLKFAARHINLPGLSPEEAERQVEDYQLDQAKMTAKAQVAGQKITEQAQQGGPPEGVPVPQRRQFPRPPGGAQMQQALAARAGANGQG